MSLEELKDTAWNDIVGQFIESEIAAEQERNKVNIIIKQEWSE